METGHVVRFASQQHPFLIESAPCLDLNCSCSITTLTFSELVPPAAPPRDRLTFTVRLCLKTGSEHDPPPRSLEVESLVREFLAFFPAERIDELAEEFDQRRGVEKRLKSFTLSGDRNELVTYSDVIDERGGVREGVTEHSRFFVFEGREFLVEDHYCANPDCDCRKVHLEFWERVPEFHPKKRGVTIRQRLMTTFTLEGEHRETRFSQESASTTKRLLQAWLRRGGDHFRECRSRYDLIKTVGARSFPRKPKPPAAVFADTAAKFDNRAPLDSRPKVRRNDPCPCGSGLKFKRCCARRSAIAD